MARLEAQGRGHAWLPRGRPVHRKGRWPRRRKPGPGASPALPAAVAPARSQTPPRGLIAALPGAGSCPVLTARPAGPRPPLTRQQGEWEAEEMAQRSPSRCRNQSPYLKLQTMEFQVRGVKVMGKGSPLFSQGSKISCENPTGRPVPPWRTWGPPLCSSGE